jgi:hypothetical protein
MKNRNSRMREIAFHTLFCMVSMVSILLNAKKYSQKMIGSTMVTIESIMLFQQLLEKHSHSHLRGTRFK